MSTELKNYIKREAIKAAEGHHPCIKQSVFAMIEKDGKEIFGSNKMLNDEVTECPRELQGYVSGAGYHLCTEICKQESHAEVDAIKAAEAQGIDISGGKLTLVSHTYCCNNCEDAMASVGIEDIIIL